MYGSTTPALKDHTHDVEDSKDLPKIATPAKVKFMNVDSLALPLNTWTNTSPCYAHSFELVCKTGDQGNVNSVKCEWCCAWCHTRSVTQNSLPPKPEPCPRAPPVDSFQTEDLEHFHGDCSRLDCSLCNPGKTNKPLRPDLFWSKPQ